MLNLRVLITHHKQDIWKLISKALSIMQVAGDVP